MMKYISVPETTFETLIESLEAALNVCYNVDYQSDEPEKSSAFACGYCRSALKATIDNLKYIKS
jgi:hypothetical protein